MQYSISKPTKAQNQTLVATANTTHIHKEQENRETPTLNDLKENKK